MLDRLILALLLALPLGGAGTSAADEVKLTDYVNPFIGTTNYGTTNPGAVCPNGMMSVTPFNVTGSDLNRKDKDSDWWSTPYLYENKYLTGFSHVNLSGVGCPEMGAILTMPTAGALEVDYHKYGSEYTDEIAEPGYYSTLLTYYGIRAELSATTRTSIERYTFKEGQGNILVNLGVGLTNETGAWIREVSPTEIEGMRLLGTFCYNPQAVFPQYFALRVSRTPKARGFWKKQPPMTAEAAWDQDAGKYKIYTRYNKEMAGDDIGYWFSFDTDEGEEILVQVGVSFVSTENAWENLAAEQPLEPYCSRSEPSEMDFDKVRQEAHDRWEADLGRIRVEGGTTDQKTIFYTALYHALIHPNVLSDVNGDYPLMEYAANPEMAPDSEGLQSKTAENDGSPVSNMGSTNEKAKNRGQRYTVFSLWDTCRNLHQLLTLVYPERQLDMVRSMVDMYNESGWLPRWELYGRETYAMEGDPAVPVIVDTWLKGLKDFDMDTAFEAMVKSAETEGAKNPIRRDNDPYLEKGYIPLGVYEADFSGDNSIAHALEYYVADNALYKYCLASGKGLEAVAQQALWRSRGYKNYFSEEYGCLRPKLKDGTFYSPFNPRHGENWSPVIGFHEGSAWNYSFYIPHDVEGMIEMYGGKKKFTEALQKVFDEELFDPSNEPDIAYPYLFDFVDEEAWRTDAIVKNILQTYYKNSPNGIPGNDDAGTMSAWAIFSMMGFYPDCPGEPHYTLTEPTFDKVTITLNPKYTGGKSKLEIIKGKTRSANIISHDELVGSGRLIIGPAKKGKAAKNKYPTKK